MTAEELAEIEARANAATQGPWKAFIEGREHESGSSFIMTTSPSGRGPDLEILGAAPADLDFIAHARSDVTRLIDEVRRLHQGSRIPDEP